MKKKIPLFVLLLIVCVFVIYATTVTKVYHKEVRIGYSLLQISEKMISIKKVARWYLPFAILDTGKNVFDGPKHTLTNTNHSLEIKESSPFDAFYKVTENNKSRLFRFTIIPDSAHSCQVMLKYESTLWSKIWGADDLTANAEKSLNNLKEYFSETKKMYGFDMEITQVVDTAFLFLSDIVPNAAKRVGTKKIFETLIEYAKQKNAAYNGTRIFYYNAADKDSLHLFAGIGVTNTSSLNDWNNNNQILLKKMPFKNKLLVAYYQGAYKNMPYVFSKLEEYKNDHNFTGVALPFTKFLTDGYDFADDQVIQAVACYPIL